MEYARNKFIKFIKKAITIGPTSSTCGQLSERTSNRAALEGYSMSVKFQ